MENLNFEKGGYSEPLAYGRSKLYAVYFTRALAERIPESQGISVSLDPGFVRTDITREIFQGTKAIIVNILYPLLCLLTLNAKEGAQTSIFACLSPDVKSGQYYSNCAPSQQNDNVTP